MRHKLKRALFLRSFFLFVKMSENKIKFGNLKELAWSVGVYTSASILGPILLLGGIGYAIDYYLDTKPIFLLLGIFTAFISTNILIFKKVKEMQRKIEADDSKKACPPEKGPACR